MSNNSDNKLMIIIFGATGDLTKRKLIPALFKLYSDQELNTTNPIICISRSKMSNQEYLSKLELEKYTTNDKKQTRTNFNKLIQYRTLDFSDNCYAEKCKDCKKCEELKEVVNTLDKQSRCMGNIIYYLATPPSTFANISRIISQTLPENCKGSMKIAFEKPFGYSLSSSRELNSSISKLFTESQIYRVDHYLGKALVQDILLFRFSNLIYEQVWNNQFIENIQITISEQLGVEYRAGYYDKTGAIKDMLQNHLIQLVSLTTMDEPMSFDANDVRQEMAKVLKDLKLPNIDDLIIGQYQDNYEKELASYIEEKGVDSHSKTETFVALKMEVDNERWKGVPIYVRTGKRLKNTFAEINIVLKDVTCKLFMKEACNYKSPNIITIRIQPNTGIALSFNIKRPGPGLEIMPVEMDFCHHCLFNINTPEAYEAVFQAIINGDQTIFTSWESIESSWKYTDHVLQLAAKKDLSYYKADSTGSIESYKLLEDRGHHWINNSMES